LRKGNLHFPCLSLEEEKFNLSFLTNFASLAKTIGKNKTEKMKIWLMFNMSFALNLKIFKSE